MAQRAKRKKPKSAPESKTYKLIELVGTSPKSYEDAIENAIADAGTTVKGLSWFEVVELRGHLDAGKVQEYQAKIKVGFRVIH